MTSRVSRNKAMRCVSTARLRVMHGRCPLPVENVLCSSDNMLD
jgi:hypothetical protein